MKKSGKYKLSNCESIFIWGGRWGSNPQPLGPQPSAPPLSYDHHERTIKPAYSRAKPARWQEQKWGLILNFPDDKAV